MTGPNELSPPADATPRQLVDHLRRYFADGYTQHLPWRRQQLVGLRQMLKMHRDEFGEALRADLGLRPEVATTLEIDLCTSSELETAVASLDEWAAEQSVSGALVQQPVRCVVQRQPVGVVLVLGTWNFPVHLLLNPLIGALAAGNCVIVKPSEGAPHTASLLARTLPYYVDTSAVAVVTGGADVSRELVRCGFDHIFFTGGTETGRQVLRAAAETLTPVTLELGGKCPCFVDDDADLVVAARRIALGKFSNAGQACLAPDYVLVHEAVAEAFVEHLRTVLLQFYGPEPRSSADYSRIASEAHTRRLRGLLEAAAGRVVCGGAVDVVDRYVAPTVVFDPPPDSSLLREEIFGPILPVVRVPSVAAAVRFISARPRPLAVYMFSGSQTRQEAFARCTVSGSVAFNEVTMHLVSPNLPFGGVGASGFGRYHGRHSFDTFSNVRSVVYKSTALDIPLRYPPYTTLRLRAMSLLARLSSGSLLAGLPWRRYLLLVVLVLAGLGVLRRYLGRWLRMRAVRMAVGDELGGAMPSVRRAIGFGTTQRR